MNCRESEQLILAERDGALEASMRAAALDAHIATCEPCQRLRAAVNGGSVLLRESARAVPLPDIAAEWHEIRRRIDTPGPVARTWPQFMPLPAVALAAAAVLAVAFLAIPQWFADGAAEPESLVARAEFVEVPGSDASTFVFVDEASGWLVVWAAGSEDLGG